MGIPDVGCARQRLAHKGDLTREAGAESAVMHRVALFNQAHDGMPDLPIEEGAC